jgi:anti-sigma factor RsiW
MRIIGSSGDSHPTDARLVLALDGELEACEAAIVGEHVAVCQACREKCAHWSLMSQRIGEYHRNFLPIPQSNTFAEQLDRLLADGKPAALRSWWQILTSPRAVAAFASVAFALLVLAWNLTRPSAVPMPRYVAVRTAQDPPRLNPALVPTPVAHNSTRRRRAQVAPVDVDSFIALPYSDAALPLSGATTLRVQLPVEDLWLAGVMVDSGRAGAIVQADIIMGMDGLPRAMRLVQ